jgi:hypothetical protein
VSEEALLSLLKDDVNIGVDARVYLEFAPTPAAFPYIVFDVDGTDPVLAHDGGSKLARRTFRIECWGTTAIQSRSVADAVRAKIQGFKGTAASVRVDSIIVLEGGRTESTMPDDGGDTPSSMRLVLVAMWFEDANN